MRIDDLALFFKVESLLVVLNLCVFQLSWVVLAIV